MAGTSQATPKTYPVILHVYDASLFNPLVRFCSGFKRSSIEVHGVEYMFLDYINNNGRKAGRLLVGNPSQYATINKGLKLYQSIVVDRTHKSNAEAEEGIHALLTSNVYHYLDKNSHDFAESAWEFLVGFIRGNQSMRWVGRCDRWEKEYEVWKVTVTENMLAAGEGLKATFPVVLHVYKVPSDTMRRCFGFKLSICRSSVEVHGVEYMFCEHDGMAGIMMTTPRHMANMKGLEFAKSIMMGRTELEDAAKVKAVVERVGSVGGYGVYPRNVYDYISKNCHHFSDDLCNALVGKGIPGWIKRAGFYERNYTGEVLTGRERQGRENPQRWTNGHLFMSWNPPRDCWPVRMLNYINKNDEHIKV